MREHARSEGERAHEARGAFDVELFGELTSETRFGRLILVKLAARELKQ